MAKILSFCLSLIMFNGYTQSGADTTTPHSSAIFDLNTLNKGFKGPNVSLLNINDIATISNPAIGLIVFNIANNGTPPNDVYTNAYYYWNGTQWFHIPTTRVVEEIFTPGVFVLNSSNNQTITNINNGVHNVVTFPNPQIINVGNIASQTNNEIVTILETGLYELSGFVNYNPNQDTSERRAMLNTYIERRKGSNGAWELIAGGRTAWGRETTDYLQTATIPITCVLLNEKDQLRFTLANKITSGTRSQHGNTSYIQTTTNSPISKSLRLYLIGYEN
jgi:hypothetical protein